MAGVCTHEVNATGTLAQIKALRRTFKQQGFMDQEASDAWPLNGHWETEHGLTVIIEGKMVRWSRQRASKLTFTRKDRRTCMLGVYGEPTPGKLVSPQATNPGATRALKWGNGDVWHSYDGHNLGKNTVYSQTLSKTLRDDMQDDAYRSQADAMIKRVSKHRLGMPAFLEGIVVQFLGNDMYYVRVQFSSKWNPACKCDDSDPTEIDLFDSLSRRHPRVGLRHCWAEERAGCCGQRTLVNGEEVSEDILSRHTKATHRA